MKLSCYIFRLYLDIFIYGLISLILIVYSLKKTERYFFNFIREEDFQVYNSKRINFLTVLLINNWRQITMTTLYLF